MTVPASHREVITAMASGQVTLTKHPDKCLMFFPRPSWITFRDKVASLPMSAAGWRRMFLGGAQDVDVDGAGRVLISPELRAWAGLEKGVMLIGQGSYLEVWDSERYAAQEAATSVEPMPASLMDFSLGL